MRIRLKWKLAGAFAMVIAVVAAGLVFALQAVAERHTMRLLRENLATQGAMIHAIVQGGTAGRLPEYLRNFGGSTDTRITVYGPRGDIVADTADSSAVREGAATPQEVRQARREGMGWAIRRPPGSDSELMYVATSREEDGYVVRVAKPVHTARQSIGALRNAILIACVIAAALAIVLGISIAHRISHSLDEVAEAAQRIGEGDLDARVRATGTEEIERVGDVLSTMAGSLSRARSDLQQQAAHLRAVLSQIPDGVIVVDPTETIEVFNDAAGRLLSVAPEAAVGNPLVEVTLHYDLVQLVRRSLRLRTATQQHVVTIQQTDAQVAAAASSIEDDRGQLQGAVLTLRDISQLIHLRQIRKDFVMNASHELRTPVSAIRSLAETLRDGAINDGAAAPSFLNQIVENTERLSNLVEDLMELTRLEAGPGPERERVRVGRLAQIAASRIAPQAGDKGIQVRVDVPEGLDVWCSWEDLLTALTNLLDNAVKYAPQDGEVVVSAEAIDGGVSLAVSDNGPGIPEAERERVFNRFYRVDKARSRQLGGTGLGLSIVKHAVESNGGRVWAEESSSGGARIVMTVPAYAADAHTASDESPD